MPAVVAVTTIRLKPGGREVAEPRLRRLAERTAAEPGCLSYAIHEDVDDPRTLVVIEHWASQVELENHLLQPYVRDTVGGAHALLEGLPEHRVLRVLPA